MMSRARVALVIGILLLASCQRQASAPAPDSIAAGTGLAVDATWLAQHAADADLVVLHIAADSANAQRIPGVQFVPLSALAIERDGNVNELPPLDELRATFERAGVGDSTRVIIHGQPLHAARAFVALDVLGHTRTALLDGGPAAWAAAGGVPITAVPPAGARITSAPRVGLVVDADYVRDRLDRKEVLLLDARPEDQYAEGRIPGAGSLFWEHTLVSAADSRLRPVAELHALFDNAGGDLATELVSYCRTGMQAGFLYFVARHLGYDVRLYDGSYADWTARTLPVER